MAVIRENLNVTNKLPARHNNEEEEKNNKVHFLTQINVYM